MTQRNKIFTIARKEYRTAVGNRMLLLLAVIAWLLIAFGTYTGWQRQQKANTQKERASKMFREEWEEQNANPHSAAHFGTWLFKPGSALAMYDNGLNTYLGISYRVEAHVQHEVNRSEAEEQDSHLRFGELSVAMVFQVLLPLLIFLITFNAVTSEREGNTLRMLLIQGVKPRTIIWGKIVGSYAILATVIIPALLMMAIPLLITPANEDLIVRYGLFSLSYLLFFFVVSCIGVAISAFFKKSNSALVTALALWFLMAVLMPRLVIRALDAADPVPSRYEFNRHVSQGYQQGLGNDGSSRDRYKKYLKQTLKKYGVDSVAKLPLNFDGLSMQYGEDYNSKVYEHYAQQLQSIILRQQTRLEQASMLNPFMAVQQVSMGLAGTDYYHHLSFHGQAKAYRNEFIRALNMDLANSGSAYLSYSYKVGPDFFKKVKDFQFRPPTIQYVLRWHRWAVVSLVVWVLAVMLLMVPIASKRLK